jgi:hypothetical protein
VTSLPRWSAEWPHAWIALVLAAATWSLALASATEPATLRSLVFLGGPLVLLAGLHARLTEFLHGRARARLATLPVAPARHFAAAGAAHRRGLALASACGLLGLGLGVTAATGDPRQALVLAGDFAWLCALAALIEPLIPAASAYAGRRFPDEHPLRQAQRQLGGGWTAPEAAVHLYAPALGLGLAVLLAMPGQLAAARLAEGHALAPAHAALWLVPLALAATGRALAPRVYARGFFEAVAWLAEATRSLAGPPEPPPRPGWVARIASPTLRLHATQWLRLTPAPLLRLAALVGWGGYLLLRAAPPTAPTLGLGLGLAALWLVPLQTLARQRRRTAAALVSLPLAASARAGRSPALTAALLLPPALIAVAIAARAAG